MTSRFLGNEGKNIGKDYDKYGVGDEGKARRGKKRKDRRSED